MPHPLPLVLLLALGSPSQPAAATAPALLWLGPFDEGAIDGPALVDAVTIYTRDLRVQVRSASGVPPPTAAQRTLGRDVSAGAVVAAAGARLGFWCLPSADGKTIVLATVDARGRIASRLVDRAGLRRPDLSRAIALKLRAILAEPNAAEPNAAEPNAAEPNAAEPNAGPELPPDSVPPRGFAIAPPRPPTASPRQSVVAPPPVQAATAYLTARRGPSSSAAVGPAPKPPSPPVLPPPVAAAPAETSHRIAPSTPPGVPPLSRRAAPSRSGGRFFAVLGYRLSAPLGEGTLQPGITAGVGAHGRAFEAEVGAAIEERATAASRGDAVSLFDLPVSLEARWVHRGRRVSWGGGVFGALHLLWATATAPGRPVERAFEPGGGAGLAALIRVALGHEVALQARLFGELALPSIRYWVADTELLERGPRVGAGISLVFPEF